MKINNKNISYSDAIEKVMLSNGYFAPLKIIYTEIWKYKAKSNIKGITPEYTIQERVQRDTRFTRIGLGVYALTEYLQKLPQLPELKTIKSKNQVIKRKHATIQGMLIEIGNYKKDIRDTYTNDKKFIFENKTLGSMITLKKIPNFTYEHIIRDTVNYADVIWFNMRGFPSKIFEVEESTDFRDALVKFSELQDFSTQFICVSDEKRKSKFDKEISKNAFSPIKEKCSFITYEQVTNDYEIILQKTYL